MALMDISVIPLDGKGHGYSAAIAELERIIEKTGLESRLYDMGTLVYGPAPRLFELAAELHEQFFSTGSRRVYTVMKMDDRRDREVLPGEKVASVRKQLADS